MPQTNVPQTEETPDDNSWLDDLDNYAAEDRLCHTCGGDGWVESVADATGRYGWDPDDTGTCPNCRGTGLAKDCTTF